MKTLRYMLILATGLLVVFSSSALARPKVNVNISLGGRPGFHHNRHDNRFSHRPRHFEPARGRWNHRPSRQTIIIGGGCWYDRRPNYYVVAPPRIIEREPIVIEKQTVIVQQQQFDDSTLQLNLNLQRKKNELLIQLRASDKELRRGAIKELAAFSFDDNVRYALENILLSDPSSELRAEAADAFGRVKNAGALPALEKARVEDVSADVRRAANEAIENIEGN